MTRSRKPAKKPTATMEARRTNVLLEALRKELSVISEDQRGLRSEFGTFKAALGEVAEDVKRMKPIVRSLAPVPDQLKNLAARLGQLENDVGELKKDVKDIKDRLGAAEAKLAP